MNQKTLLKAVATVERIKVLDAEIISLEKLAIAIADRDHECSIALTAKDLAPAKGEKKAVLDADGSLAKPTEGPSDMMRAMMFGFHMYGGPSKKEEKPADALNFDLSNHDMLQVLGLLTGNRQREREGYMEALVDLGVVFN